MTEHDPLAKPRFRDDLKWFGPLFAAVVCIVTIPVMWFVVEHDGLPW